MRRKHSRLTVHRQLRERFTKMPLRKGVVRATAADVAILAGVEVEDVDAGEIAVDVAVGDVVVVDVVEEIGTLNVQLLLPRMVPLEGKLEERGSLAKSGRGLLSRMVDLMLGFAGQGRMDHQLFRRRKRPKLMHRLLVARRSNTSCRRFWFSRTAGMSDDAGQLFAH